MTINPFKCRSDVRLLVAACLMPAMVTPGLAADNAADFYRGQTVRMIIGYPAGSGYDVHARALVNHMAKHIPGKPTLIPQNMPGAGSMKATNWLTEVAPRDGTAMAAINRSLALAPLLETDAKKKAQIKFNALELSWIGSMDKDVSLGICRSDAGITSLQEFAKKEVIATASAPSSDSFVFPTVMNKLLGTKIKVVGGRQGSGDNFLALERNEAQCYLGTSYSSLSATKPEWLKPDGDVRVVIQLGSEPIPTLKAPIVHEMANDEQKAAFDLLFAAQVFARPYLAPPEIPKDRLAALRTAFEDTMKDPDFLSETKRAGIDVEPMKGEEIEKLLRRLYATKPKVVELLQSVMPQ